jgi:hypothetical protein
MFIKPSLTIEVVLNGKLGFRFVLYENSYLWSVILLINTVK